MTQAYPLQWPDGWRRTPAHQRADGRYRFAKMGYQTYKDGTPKPSPIRLSDASKSLVDELAAMGAESITISSNLSLRLDGLPYANQRTPSDPGVAVYFVHGGDSVTMARDAFDRIEDNIRSLALAIAGLRQMQRHGGSTMMKRAFRGFTALPPPDQMSVITTPVQRNWWEVLGVQPDCPQPVAEAAWKAMARSTPENERYGINAAIEAARKREA